MRLIDADLVEQLIMEHSDEIYERVEPMLSGALAAAIVYLDKCPTINAEPVRHGEWRYYGETSMMKPQFLCSACKNPRYEHYACNDFRFCPNCGAKMDGEPT